MNVLATTIKTRPESHPRLRLPAASPTSVCTPLDGDYLEDTTDDVTIGQLSFVFFCPGNEPRHGQARVIQAPRRGASLPCNDALISEGSCLNFPGSVQSSSQKSLSVIRVKERIKSRSQSWYAARVILFAQNLADFPRPRETSEEVACEFYYTH